MKSEEIKRYSEWRYIAKRLIRHYSGMFGLVLIASFLILALVAPLLGDPIKFDANALLLKPLERGHLLGTDSLGRDMLSRIASGAQISLIVGFGALLLGHSLGIPLGLLGAWWGGLPDDLLMRVVDVIWAVPVVMLAIFVGAVFGPSITNLTIVVSVGFIVHSARMTRGLAYSIKSMDYVSAAKAMGMSDLRILVRHVFPNIIPLTLIAMGLRLGSVIIMEAGLSFLGVGVPPPHPSWGRLLSEGWPYLRTNPTLCIFPGLAISLIVLGFNLFSDALRDCMDPRLR